MKKFTPSFEEFVNETVPAKWILFKDLPIGAQFHRYGKEEGQRWKKISKTTAKLIKKGKTNDTVGRESIIPKTQMYDIPDVIFPKGYKK